MVVNMNCEGCILAPCAILLLLFLLIKNDNISVSYHSSTENNLVKEILAVASKSEAVPVLGRGFVAVQGGHLEVQRWR